jgi:hypothetical protein
MEVIDQADPTEVEPAIARQIQTWQQNVAAWALGEPEDDETPVEDQLTAMNHRVNNQLRSPHGDFAVWGPFARKLIRAMKFRAWVPQSDGTFLAREISGPQDYNCWLPPMGVFTVAAHMIRVLSESVLRRYQKHIFRLATDWPECWGLIYVAGDEWHTDYVTICKRRCEALAAVGTPPKGWDAARPWESAWTTGIEDDQWGQRRVTNPAM